MAPATQRVFLVRHGPTQWSVAGRHTGRSDLPLTDEGRRLARALAPRLAQERFAAVWTSPLVRASQTAALAGFPRARPLPELQEWDYGAAEGFTTAELKARHPGWSLWRDGVEGGETLAQVAERAERALAQARAVDGDALLFAHGHLLRVLAARALGLPAQFAQRLALGTACLGVLAWAEGLASLERWNEPPPGASADP